MGIPPMVHFIEKCNRRIFAICFFQLFNQTIEKCPQEDESVDRAEVLINATTLATYNNVARGLFAQDKLVFSFMLCAKILLHEGTIVQSEWDYLVSTATQSDRSTPPQPGVTVNWLGARQWKAICDLVDGLPDTFNGLLEDVAEGRKIILNICGHQDGSNEGLRIILTSPPGEDGITGAEANWDDRLSLFQKIILVRALREEEFVAAVTTFVRIQLGQQFVETPSIDLPLVYADMDATTPLVFVLSTGSDPMAQLQRFARQMEYSERIHSVSLGQGQGPMAEKLLAKAAESGDWVFLQASNACYFDETLSAVVNLLVVRKRDGL